MLHKCTDKSLSPTISAVTSHWVRHCPKTRQQSQPRRSKSIVPRDWQTVPLFLQLFFFVHLNYKCQLGTDANSICPEYRDSLVTQTVKSLPAVQETQVLSLGQEDPVEKEMATCFSILTWKIPWTEEPGGLQSIGSQKVRHDWATSLSFSMFLINRLKLFSIFLNIENIGVRLS